MHSSNKDYKQNLRLSSNAPWQVLIRVILLLLILGWPSSCAISEPQSDQQTEPPVFKVQATLPPATILAPPATATARPTIDPQLTVGSTDSTPANIAVASLTPEAPSQLSPAVATAFTTTVVPDSVRFAVIGDYGYAGAAELAVANLVKSWKPDLVITTGDNNYPVGAQETIDDNVGQYYAEFIHPYSGAYGPGAAENRFFPTPGNHDWDSDNLAPYIDYFSLPGNERYYDFVWGPVHFFAVDSDSREPDGVSPSSVQATWLRDTLANSTAPWKIVFTHLSPYSSAYHGSIGWMRWPFAEWGATAVLAGHDHVYERILVDGFPYIVNGLGGYPARYPFLFPVGGSQVRYSSDYGAMLVEADQLQITFQFFTVNDELIDSYTLTRSPDTE